MLQKLFGKLNMLEIKTIKYLLTNHNSFLLLYIMEATIKETYEENFGTAYETYKQSVRKITVSDYKM